MATGQLSVNTGNIFPIIKKFLYSDHEIFLRELVSNAVDATGKVQMLAAKENLELGDVTIHVKIDKDARTISITDRGIGMTAEEVEKYINQIAFSSAEEFVERFKNESDKKNIIGHFGLGFYSAFMVAEKVELKTRSYKEDAEPVHWVCEGSTTYEMEKGEKDDRGTEVILHINEESDEFLEEARAESLLKRYCSYMPVPITFNGNVINNTEPLWLKQPSELTDEDYKNLYKELYPYSGDPLLWIHLNVDYPFNLTGILYFPKVNSSLEVQKQKIQLYSNQVFVTDSVEEVVPEFLTLLHGVIDSPDIPLNVSRSYLQADANVKKVSGYIVKKVADKLEELFRKERTSFEEKWDNIGFFIKYGMLSNDKFEDKAKKFALVKNIVGSYYTLDEYKAHTEVNQLDKDSNNVWLYTNAPKQQDAYVKRALQEEYDVLEFDQGIDTHFVNFLERELEKVMLKRVDAGPIDELINKGIEKTSSLSDEQKTDLESIFSSINDEKYQLKLQPLSPEDPPVLLAQQEFMRRMQEMSRLQGVTQEMPGAYDMIINTNNPIHTRLLLSTDEDKRKEQAGYLLDLAKLQNGMLQGPELTDFISKSLKQLN